jgi:hypothetical protein
MRLIAFFFLLIVSVGCDNTKNVKMKPNELNSTWIPINEEIAGKQLPSAAFEKQELIINDNLYTFTAESVDKGEVRYSKGKMDIYGKKG